MRVTFVLNHVNLSGGIRVVAIYAERLKRRGHDVVVVTRPRPVPSLGDRVKSVVKGHKGTVAAESAGLDRGSTFTVTLPGIIEPAAEDAGAPEEVAG